MSNFDNFLKKMMGDTEPQKINEGKVRTEGSKPKAETPRPATKPQPQKVQRQESINEDNEDEIVERAFEYAATFSKIVRKNFPNKSDRKIVLESVRNAINMMLGESTGSVATVSNSRQPMITSNDQVEESESDPYEILKQAQMSRLPDNFNPNVSVKGDLNIKGKMNEKGETEVDLSEMTAEDMQALKMLSGITSIPGQEQTIPKDAEEEIQAVMNG